MLCKLSTKLQWEALKWTREKPVEKNLLRKAYLVPT